MVNGEWCGRWWMVDDDEWMVDGGMSYTLMEKEKEKEKEAAHDCQFVTSSRAKRILSGF